MPKKSIAREYAIQTLSNWIDVAKAECLNQHFKEFWTMRDVLEEKLNISQDRADQALKFLRDKCKQSYDKELILKELEAKS